MIIAGLIVFLKIIEGQFVFLFQDKAIKQFDLSYVLD